MATTKVISNLIDLSGDSGAIVWATGTSAQRPTSPVAGDFRYNTTVNRFEFYNGTIWLAISNFALPFAVDFLMVAGGGAGGSRFSSGSPTTGGGGAGGLRTSYGSTSGGGAVSESPISFYGGTTYTITVGAGGTMQFGQYATNGIDSQITDSNIFTISSAGGGRGGGNDIPSGAVTAANNGGSGGGAGGASGYIGLGTSGQGFGGGSAPGGGGGASQAGNTNAATYGGDGLAVSITGSSVTYAGGGGAGPSGIGGAGGGGSAQAGAGSANTGGGGAGISSGTSGGLGGSGIVILRLPTSQYSGITTGSPTVTTDGTDTIIKYTGSGTYTA